MGEITITGKAKKRVTADMMGISFTISAEEKSTYRALEEISKQTEEFFERLAEIGLNIKDIKLVGDGVNENHNYSTSEDNYKAHREYKINTVADIAFSNLFFNQIKESKSNITAQVNYFYKSLNELHSKLIEEAVLDSKEKATMIAKSLGADVKGIKEILDQASRYRDNFAIPQFLAKSICVESDEPILANLVGLPELEEKEEIVVTWVVE